MKFQIVTDSSADLSAEYAEAAGVTVVPFYVSLDGQTYLREGRELAVSEMYARMIADPDCFPKTSMPSVQDYIDAFMPAVKQKMPVLCICLTAKFSGSLQSAANAAMAVRDDEPDAEIYVMDSKLVTALQGLLVNEAVRLRDLNMTLREAVPLLENIRNTGRIFFTTKDLKYLEHGGRLGRVACMAGSILNLKPILQFSEGALGRPEICRGRKRSLQRVADSFCQFVTEHQIDLKQYWFGTGLGLDIPEYDEFLEAIGSRLKEAGLQPQCWIKIHIGATIGVHTGPYPMGVGILKRCEV